MRAFGTYALLLTALAGAATASALQAGRADPLPTERTAEDPGARLPWDYPLPPLQWMLHPDGPPANGKPPETTGAPPISLAVAQQAAQAAQAACQRDGLNVGIAVLDTAGDVRFATSSDGVSPGKIYTAIRKALGALEFQVPTSRIAGIVQANPAQEKRIRPYMAVFPGGVPLIRDGKLYGAIAASGAKAVQDEACAMAGATAVASGL